LTNSKLGGSEQVELVPLLLALAMSDLLEELTCLLMLLDHDPFAWAFLSLTMVRTKMQKGMAFASLMVHKRS
jgi:hypothetical protein